MWKPIEEAPKDRPILVCGGTYTWDADYSDEVPFKRVALVYYQPSIYDPRKVWQGDSTGYQDEYYWYFPKYYQEVPEPKLD